MIVLYFVTKKNNLEFAWDFGRKHVFKYSKTNSYWTSSSVN